jgi:hypothetical protein
MSYGNNLVEANRLVGVYVGGGRRQRTDQLCLRLTRPRFLRNGRGEPRYLRNAVGPRQISLRSARSRFSGLPVTGP